MLKKYLNKVVVITIAILAILSYIVYAATEQTVTMYAADGRTINVNEDDIQEYQSVNWSLKPPITLYDKDGNTVQIIEEHLAYYVNDKYQWWTEPVTLMYATDGRTTYIINSEVDMYTQVGWSIHPPITLYKKGSGEAFNVLEHEVLSYLSLGTYCTNYEEACPAIFTYEPFKKSNLNVEQLNRVLSNTGLQGQGQAFYDMEHKYNVNALFAIAVACHESANGYKKANRNNFFGMRGGKGWMAFNSPYDNIMYFGKLMNKPIYYGKSIEGIAQKYCNPPGHWISCVKKHMQEKWEKI